MVVHLAVEVMVSLKATFGFPVTHGQLYSVLSRCHRQRERESHIWSLELYDLHTSAYTSK